MLRMSVAAREYLMLGDDIKIVFLGGSGKHMRIMIDAPREINVVRSRVLEKEISEQERAKLPKYYSQEKIERDRHRREPGKPLTGNRRMRWRTVRARREVRASGLL